MKKIALVTCDFIPELIDAEKEIPSQLKKYNIDAVPVVWDDENVDWKEFDKIIIRTPWDYFTKIEPFYEWLDMIDKTGIEIHNSISVIKWNLHKYYLRDLKEKGVNIIPTVFINKHTEANLDELMKVKGWDKVIIKPAVSAAAHKTYLFNEENIQTGQETLTELLKNGDVLLQEFQFTIKYEGEWSMIYYYGKYSHSIRKLPNDGDFRVQKLHGGTYHYNEAPNKIIEQTDKIIQIEGKDLLYARVDGIVHEDVFYLMELELIEPELFLEHSETAKENFIKALLQLDGQIK